MSADRFLWQLTQGGRTRHLAPDWSLGLLSAVWAAAAAGRTRGPLAWEVWLPMDGGWTAHTVTGGMS